MPGNGLPQPVRLFVVDGDPIYRRGMMTCLQALAGVESVAEAGAVTEAVRHPAFAAAHLVIVDPAVAGGFDLIRDVREAHRARVLACCSNCEEDVILAAVEAGASGVLCKHTLSPDGLGAYVHAALHGAGVMAPDALDRLLEGLRRVSRDVLEPRGLSLSRLTSREQQVLRLIAQGFPTREVAKELCYSERTVKNVVHDVVTKLGARSRSQAVAHAVREGLI